MAHHNRTEREAPLKAKYEFYVPSPNEYSVFNALLIAADVIITGGNTSFQYLKDNLQQFAIDLATAMAQAGLNPLTETLYFDKFIFENWETPLGVHVQLPNKFVPYVAARKKPNPPPQPVPIHWQQMPGAAFDIGIGANGSVWVIGTNLVGNGDFGIWHWSITGDWDKNAWQSVPGGGGGVRIAVAPDGHPWVVNNAGSIFRYTANGFVPLPGLARDIGIGANGSVWVIGTNPVGNGDFGIWHWNPAGNNWVSIDGGGREVSVDPQGKPWVVNSSHSIYRRF